MHVGRGISPTSPPYLPCISHVSPLCLPYISRSTRRAPNPNPNPNLHAHHHPNPNPNPNPNPIPTPTPTPNPNPNQVDEPSSALIAKFYATLRASPNTSQAEALRAAMLAVRKARTWEAQP